MSEGRPQWFLPSGTARRDGCDVLVDPSLPGWQHTGLRVVTLDVGEHWALDEAGWEYVVVPLSGSASVTCTDPAGETHRAALRGRASVFAGSTDVAYVPAGSSLEVSGTAAGSRIAICAARVRGAGTATSFRHVAADEVPVELRGAGQLLTRGPQLRRSRHSRRRLDHRGGGGHPGRQLELVPAAQARRGPRRGRDRARGDLLLRDPGRGWCSATGRHDPVGYQRVYGTAERPIDVFAEVRTGDVVLVPHGWHGPSMAAPGYDLYYLNVMAGPGDQRAWLICDDPSHGWVRQTWEGMAVDPRLPLAGDPR